MDRRGKRTRDGGKKRTRKEKREKGNFVVSRINSSRAPSEVAVAVAAAARAVIGLLTAWGFCWSCETRAPPRSWNLQQNQDDQLAPASSSLPRFNGGKVGMRRRGPRARWAGSIRCSNNSRRRRATSTAASSSPTRPRYVRQPQYMMGVRETSHRDDPPSRKKEKKIGNPRRHGNERDKKKNESLPGSCCHAPPVEELCFGDA